MFSGYPYELLKRSRETIVKRLLGLIDVLSAGPYVDSLRNDKLLWRGSSNQQLIYLTNRYTVEQEDEWNVQSPLLEVTIDSDFIYRTGFVLPKICHELLG